MLVIIHTPYEISRHILHCAVWRARKNKIEWLRDDNGVFKTAPTDMQLMAVSYFKSLYTRDPSVDCERLIELTHTQLCKEFPNEEISDALFQIGSIKAPGPDDFPARFYQLCVE
jgi:hypothetical protein